MTGKNHKRTPPALKLALVMAVGLLTAVIRATPPRANACRLGNLYYQAPAIVIMALWLWVRGDLGDLRGHIYVIYLTSMTIESALELCVVRTLC